MSDRIPSAKALSAINLLLRRFLATAWRCFEFEKRQRNGETLPTDFPSFGWQSNAYVALGQASEDVLNRLLRSDARCPFGWPDELAQIFDRLRDGRNGLLTWHPSTFTNRGQNPYDFERAESVLLELDRIVKRLASMAEAPDQAPDFVTPAQTSDPQPKGENKSPPTRKIVRGKLDEHASIELTKNPSLTYEQLAEMLGCKPGTLRDKRKCPLLAAAKDEIQAQKRDFYQGDRWRDRRADEE